MANIRPFACVRPNKKVASRVAALPYDVYNREEAKEVVKNEPLSFLNIDRPETQFDDSVDMYAPEVYQKAKELLDGMIADGTFILDDERCYYVYQLIMNGRKQTGIVACASIDDYENNIIKKHELTREDKEIDRIHHVDICNAQTGPIFLAYRSNDEINRIVQNAMNREAIYQFTAEDGVRHNVWKIADKEDVDIIYHAFLGIREIYIADGHHRAASAVKVGLKRRMENKEYTGEEEFNYFLSVLFPDEELKILPYNRVVRDLNGHSKMEYLELISRDFKVTLLGAKPFAPEKKATFGMYLDEEWYILEARDRIKKEIDPVKCLDVAILQDYLLHPVLGIEDPRTDKRIDFIGGIRGLQELERRVSVDCQVAFSMYPTSIHELFDVADAGRVMPPKSTWFEPKLRSGLFLHRL